MRFRRGRGRTIENNISQLEPNERFVLYTTCAWVARVFQRYPALDEETLDIVTWLTGPTIHDLNAELSELLQGKTSDLDEVLGDCRSDPSNYSRVVAESFAVAPRKAKKRMKTAIAALLDRRRSALEPKRSSSMARNISKVQRVFGLTEVERDLFLLLYVIEFWEEPESYFNRHLNCTKISGYKYLAVALGTTITELHRAMQGDLLKTGLIDQGWGDLSIEREFKSLLQDPTRGFIPSELYRPVPKETLALDAHEIPPDTLRYVVSLVCSPRNAPTNLLLYGPAGGGKTSFARRLAHEAGFPAFEVPPDEDDRTSIRRTGISACLRMKNEGRGSVVLVDEADSLLNTSDSWLSRGNRQDKAWLNELLEKPTTRIIWITNSIEGIDESVMRRFSFSLQFKSLTRSQREKLWERILRRRRIKRYFDRNDIKIFARRYEASAGAIDLAVRDAATAKLAEKTNVHEAITLALDAYTTLIQGGRENTRSRKETVSTDYSIDGLEVDGDLPGLIERLERYNRLLSSQGNQDQMPGQRLLFYGPPGTGKSELGRYLAKHLDREIIVKRASDLLNCYVGGTEQNIAAAFEQAEREEAVLVIDEVDSLLYSRTHAVRSWEISQTNELLTQMERFPGILICTTNRLQALDEASVRRFNWKLGFDFLSPEGNVIFYEKMLAPLVEAALDSEARRRLRSLRTLTPGDFKIVQDRYRMALEPPTPEEVVSELALEVKIKKTQAGPEPIGFGCPA